MFNTVIKCKLYGDYLNSSKLKGCAQDGLLTKKAFSYFIPFPVLPLGKQTTALLQVPLLLLRSHRCGTEALPSLFCSVEKETIEHLFCVLNAFSSGRIYITNWKFTLFYCLLILVFLDNPIIDIFWWIELSIWENFIFVNGETLAPHFPFFINDF